MNSGSKYVYDFAQGGAGMKELLGGKGANLSEMVSLGIPVPSGFIITTEACIYYSETGGYPEGLETEIDDHLKTLESEAGKEFGDREDPLLVSVRSGAVVSMPGMMDTVLNLGLNDVTVKGLAESTGNPRFAYDSYRRFIQMFGEVVMRVEGQIFEDALIAKKAEVGAVSDTDLLAEHLQDLIVSFKEILERETGSSFPDDPGIQLDLAIKAVFGSWGNERARVYRKANRIPHNLGTAVNVQSMVFGNKGDNSGTGVAFTRDPSSGEKVFYGEFLMNAQGEDVVAGVRHPQPLAEMERLAPEAFAQLSEIRTKLESHYRDMQDIEFTIEDNTLYMLQTRTGKRTAPAALKMAVDMVREGMISKKEALSRIEPAQLDQLLHPRLDESISYDVLTKGLNASPGAAVGRVVLDADVAQEKGEAGEEVIMVRWETTPDDIHGIIPAEGVITSHGGMTSHAAVVARGMGKPCITGAAQVNIDAKAGRFMVGDIVVEEGDWITMDGSTGRVILGKTELVPPQINEDFEQILQWADTVRTLGVRTNADNPEDSAKGREFGAEGIGLCRTEHMFMEEDRLPHMQAMILASTKEERERHLEKLLPFQRQDFEGIFRAMSGFPVTIRLLDPPLHEFLPDYTDLMVELERMRHTGASPEDMEEKQAMADRVHALEEINPMLGTRGCRLGIEFPEVYSMQVRAIIEAACDVKENSGRPPLVEIMIPLVGFARELELMRDLTERSAETVLAERGVSLEYLVGTMIELPRAALTADDISAHADFFSFGTNDLTQTTLGFSRDDAEGKFLTHYLKEEVIAENPFEKLDQTGVGQLLDTAVRKSRGVKPDIKLGICGEHGGEPSSVDFCHRVGLDYVSCSPYRVPLARLAAAQAVIASGSTE